MPNTLKLERPSFSPPSRPKKRQRPTVNESLKKEKKRDTAKKQIKEEPKANVRVIRDLLNVSLYLELRLHQQFQQLLDSRVDLKPRKSLI